MQVLQNQSQQQSWRCDVCSYDNHMLLDKCQMCQSDKPVRYKQKQVKYSQIHKQQQRTIIQRFLLCTAMNCNTENNINDLICKKCGLYLMKQLNAQMMMNIWKQEDQKCQKKEKQVDWGKKEQVQKISKTFYKIQNSLNRCTDRQKDVLSYMRIKCFPLHSDEKQNMLKKIKKMGFLKKDLDNFHHYIVNKAPIIIHMRADQDMKHFIQDTHYRSLFQTNKSHGCSKRENRIKWENKMFDCMYDQVKDQERVKYGVMNITKDLEGVPACKKYGRSYFLLKNHVRQRCTISFHSKSPLVCPLQFCFHLLSKLNFQELKAAIDASKTTQATPAKALNNFLEIQIHGPIEFNKDIQKMFISNGQMQNQSCMKMVKQFCQQNKVEYEEIDKFQNFILQTTVQQKQKNKCKHFKQFKL